MLEPPSTSSESFELSESSNAEHPPSTSMANQSLLILVVEDSHDNQALMRLILEEMGHAFVIVEDGAEAVAWLAKHIPSLILLDLSLPKIDGWQIARNLKADPATAQIPILATTAHAMQGDRERAIEAGCDDYLPKPLDLEKLEERIRYWLKQINP
ncbi:response regulator receiver protein [Thalassoporum mexicanum PCC 7367]|uniref:response regulator n=1 Tax=Thalassoporum mexicanum TaxID=3457544 RepID=UPI00029F91B4|nr:response regulator [Pseudanabaena sp. PCC 7367]AFY71472.1 response regulator receiver protein [Pseudanabaena sp. PCC 7367]